MFFFYEEMEKEISDKAELPVRIRGAYNMKAPGFPEYEVTCPYGDIVLIIAMLRDYVKCLDEVIGDDITYKAYYRKRFMKMAERLSEQIGYSYDKAVEKCRKKKEKEKKDDIGEDAIVLAVTRGARADKKKQQEQETEGAGESDEGQHI